MNFRVGIAVVAALVATAANAQTTFAHYTETNNNEFRYSEGNTVFTDTMGTVPSPVDVDFVFKAGAGALDGVHIDASLTFGATFSSGVNPASPVPGTLTTEDFALVTYTFVSKVALGTVHVGDTLLTVNANGLNALDAVVAQTTASLHGDTLNGDAITYVSAFDSLATSSPINAYSQEFTSVTPAITVAANGGGASYQSFNASDSASFSATAVPEPAGMPMLGVLAVGCGLIGLRRRSR